MNFNSVFKKAFDWSKVDQETMDFIKSHAPDFLNAMRNSFKEPINLNDDFFIGLMYAIWSFRYYTMMGPMEKKEVELFGMTYIYIKEQLLELGVSDDEFKEIEGFDFIQDDPLNRKEQINADET